MSWYKKREKSLSYQVLALKWRPKKFADAVGQNAITQTLKNSIINKKIGHAYLLTGTRGIGKTTVARVFAKAIRCLDLADDGEPCLKCENCLSIENSKSLDFIEIDGASNNSVDDIRDLIENVQYLPTTGERKVYLIDEIHMLSTPAFNALLKTLEEPPAHVVFIFATTDPQKLLGTVLSRCLRFDFKNATEADLISHLTHIAKAENINFESELIPTVIAKQASGSFRDALSLLDQVINLSSDSNIGEKTLFLSLGMAQTQSVAKIVKAIINKDKEETLAIYNEVVAENVDFKKFTLQILDMIFEAISLGATQEYMQATSAVELLWIYESIFRDLEWSMNSLDPQKATAFILMKVALREDILTGTSEPIGQKKNLNKPAIPPQEKLPVEKVEVTKKVEVAKPAPIEPVIKIAALDDISWEGFIKELYNSNKPIAVNLERGNLLNKEALGRENMTLNIAFSQDCKIFYDYLSDYENTQSLMNSLAKYLNQDVSKVSLNLNVLGKQEQIESNFQSSVEVEEKIVSLAKDKKRKEIENNKFIKEAENLFNSKVEKITLNEER